MSLTSNATNDNETYIELILNTSKVEAPTVASEQPLRTKLDITESILDKLGGFSPNCIEGYEYQVNGMYGGTHVFYSQDDLYNFADGVNHILDACIVNDKQKKAISGLILKELSNLVGKKQREIFY